jgi:hypothetical protein
MENNHNERALTTRSRISSVARNIGSYGHVLRRLAGVGKHLTYVSLPLTVGCASLQNGSFSSNVTAGSPPVDPLSIPGVYATVMMAALFGPSILLCLFHAVEQYQGNRFKVLETQGDELMQVISLASSDTQLSTPLSVDRTIAIKKTIDMQEIMQSIYGESPKNSTEMCDAFGTRYGGSYPRAFFGFYGDQRKTAKAIEKAIRLCLPQGYEDMPSKLKGPYNPTRLIGTYVQRIDKKVLKKLIKGGYNTEYHNHVTNISYQAARTLFSWDKYFVESEGSTDITYDGERRNSKGSAELSDIEIIE